MKLLDCTLRDSGYYLLWNLSSPATCGYLDPMPAGVEQISIYKLCTLPEAPHA